MTDELAELRRNEVGVLPQIEPGVFFEEGNDLARWVERQANEPPR
ncbi:hypothetical protein [Streptomyces sp. V1I1]|nr:hypothetical protein [Streptomyces sp. V1I1]MDQ0945914.1 hypothetical protein [Streptomyces sp. V1I1]